MKSPRAIGTLVAMSLVAACSAIVAPDRPQIQAIVLTVPQAFGPVLAQVNRVHVSVARPGKPARDTVLRPQFLRDRIHARAILLPDEGEPGTTVDVDLKNHEVFLFRGSVVVGVESGWPFEVRLPVNPIADFAAGADRVVTTGEEFDLGATATITFQDGGSYVPQGVAWLSSDEAVVSMNAGLATATGVGETTVLGVWYGQVDTVAIEVLPAGSVQGANPAERD